MRLLSFFLFAFAASAIDIATLQPQGYVSDFAGVVDPAAKTQLESYCAQVEKSTGVQMAFVTIPSLGGEPVEDFANALYRRWGVGQKGKDEGLLLLLVTGERRSRLEIGSGLEPIVTDGYSGSLLREMRPSLRENAFGEAVLTAAHRLGEKIAQAKGVDIAPYAPRRRVQQRETGGDIPWPVLIGGAVLLFWLMGMGGRGGRRGGGLGGFLPGLILGNVLNAGSSGGRRGGGGFGGYDSGDSFGGFGGGDSGGGGASSNW